ncbi:MAG: helix-turn-helix domain-containing protein [Candidatus Omnitrophota bacterium]
METKKYISIAQAAKIMGISRTAVYKKVKKGQIKALRVGKVFVISEDDISGTRIDVLGKPLESAQKDKIRRAVKKTIEEYGEVLKRLGNE